jgi:hypothetical protein
LISQLFVDILDLIGRANRKCIEREGGCFLTVNIPLKNLSLTWRRHHYQRRVAKFRPMLGAQGL